MPVDVDALVARVVSPVMVEQGTLTACDERSRWRSDEDAQLVVTVSSVAPFWVQESLCGEMSDADLEAVGVRLQCGIDSGFRALDLGPQFISTKDRVDRAVQVPRHVGDGARGNIDFLEAVYGAKPMEKQSLGISRWRQIVLIHVDITI